MQRFRRRGALPFVVALVSAIWSTGEAAPTKKASYGTKVTAAGRSQKPVGTAGSKRCSEGWEG
jgi:hypothetical protein